ncbi:MAG: hypothetical protein IVW57_12960 [Ktedonobacterales bacterium]|nr:hypothetical protein [Ktedonobacterales bacterium]
MPLSPAPLLPGTSPLPTPGRHPPTRRALRLGALAAVPLLVVTMTVGSLLLPRLLFIEARLQAQANGGRQAGGATFQGFVYSWSRRLSGGGYTQPISLRNLQNEAATFHMNTVIIPVFADMPQRSSNTLEWHTTDADNKDTLPDEQYIQAIKDARTAGLVPILELEVRQQDALSPSEAAAYVGHAWFDQSSNANFNLATTIVVGPEERAWIDNYTAFATHYAQISAQYRLPYFIMGDQLGDVSYDTANTVKSADPAGVAGGPKGCTGRRDCEWRHVIQAIRGASYTPLASRGTKPGGGYGGKLVYSAAWGVSASQPAVAAPEFERITWWDALDVIGVDAHFPLTRDADVSLDALTNAWHGKGPDLAGQGDIFGRLTRLSDKYARSVIFTSAGYESVPGSNGSPGQMDLSTGPNGDQSEQLSDVEALLQTFNGAPWWLGVFWSADQPLAYTSQPSWSTNTIWAGATLATSKLAGKWLAAYYSNNPLACGC